MIMMKSKINIKRTEKKQNMKITPTHIHTFGNKKTKKILVVVVDVFVVVVESNLQQQQQQQ